MSEHMRRTALLRATIAALAITAPAAWARHRLRAARCAWRRHRLHLRGPGRPKDGKPLERRESAALDGIAEASRHTARPERTRT